MMMKELLTSKDRDSQKLKWSNKMIKQSCEGGYSSYIDVNNREKF
jgi:hypothetical protein